MENEAEEEERTRLDSTIQREQLAAAVYSPPPLIKRLYYRAALSDDEHRELEGEKIGTTFRNGVIKNRLDLQHKALEGEHGVIGLHPSGSDYESHWRGCIYPT